MDRDTDTNKKNKPKRSKWAPVIIVIASISFVLIGLSLTQFGTLVALIVLIFIAAAYISVYEVIMMIRNRKDKS